jgi:hypothetical protein
MKNLITVGVIAAMAAYIIWIISADLAPEAAATPAHREVGHSHAAQLPATAPPVDLKPGEVASAPAAVSADTKGQVVVVLGKVEDIGKQTSHMLRDWEALEDLSEKEPTSLTVAEKAQLLTLQRSHAQALGILPEIAGFQDRPEEYGRFFRTMVQESLALPDPQANQVESYMRQRAVEMNRLGLNNGKEPADPKAEAAWEAQRDEFNEATFAGLQKLLPADQLKQAGIGAPLLELLENDFDKFARP